MHDDYESIHHPMLIIGFLLTNLNLGCISKGITGNPLGTSFNFETSLNVYLHILSSKLWKVITEFFHLNLKDPMHLLKQYQKHLIHH